MKWIKCSDRMPEEEVLLWNGKFVYKGSLTRFFGVTEWCIGDDEYYDIEYFTHWMPLPEGPKDEIGMNHGEWRVVDADNLPRDGSTFISLWKGRICLTQYDTEEEAFYIMFEPAEYASPWKVSKERENKFTHLMLLNDPTEEMK